MWNYLVAYLAATAISVIGLYIAFIPPIFLRYRLGDKFEHGAWSLGKHYKWIDPLAIIWVACISILFLLPPYKASIPGTEGWTWEAVNYAPILVGGALLLFGGLGMFGRQVVQGPGPDGLGRGARSAGAAARGLDRDAAGAHGLDIGTGRGAPASLPVRLISGTATAATQREPARGEKRGRVRLRPDQPRAPGGGRGAELVGGEDPGEDDARLRTEVVVRERDVGGTVATQSSP